MKCENFLCQSFWPQDKYGCMNFYETIEKCPFKVIYEAMDRKYDFKKNHPKTIECITNYRIEKNKVATI